MPPIDPRNFGRLEAEVKAVAAIFEYGAATQ
jgi:hypothetical protein